MKDGPFRVMKYVTAAETLTKLAFASVSDGSWWIDVYSARPELPEDRDAIMRLAQRVADGLNATNRTNEAKHNPEPWEYENVQRPEDRDAYGVVKDANGKILFDTINSDVAEIHTEHDEGSVYRWDEQARVNLTLAAAAPALLAACELWDKGFVEGEQFDEAQFLKWVNDNRRAARAVIAKVKGQ